MELTRREPSRSGTLKPVKVQAQTAVEYISLLHFDFFSVSVSSSDCM